MISTDLEVMWGKRHRLLGVVENVQLKAEPAHRN
jgi:hypothetical protein